jgi:hypothetical protein
MRYFSYVEPGDDELSVNKIVVSEEEILHQFWEYWCSRMKETGNVNLIDKNMCIEDWCTLNWATPEDIFRFRSGYPDKIFCINEFNTLDPNFEWATVVCLNDPRVVIPGYINVVTQMERVG